MAKIILAVLVAVQFLLAQEIDTSALEHEVAPAEEPAAVPELVPTPEPPPKPAPVSVPAPVAALPKLSVAQALSSLNLPKGCAEDFASLLGKNGFDMAKFMKDLPPDVAKVKLQLKSPFGKPKDEDRTNSGLTVGCIKALPESPAEIQSLLKNISLKMGLDLAVETAENFVDNAISANVPKENGSVGGVLKTVISIGLATGGLGWVIYGIRQDGNVARYVDSKNGKAAVNAEKSRNMSYGIGAALLAGGLIVYLVF